MSFDISYSFKDDIKFQLKKYSFLAINSGFGEISYLILLFGLFTMFLIVLSQAQNMFMQLELQLSCINNTYQ